MPPVFHRPPPLSALGSLLLSGLMATALNTAAASAEDQPKTQHFLIEGAVPADRANGIVLNLGTATLTPESLVLHIGFRNMGVATVPTYGKLGEADFHLSEKDSFSEINATSLSPELGFVSPPDGLPSRIANSGRVTFPVPGSLENLNLRVSGFAPVPFSLAPEARFRPCEPGAGISVKLQGTVLQSSHEHLSIFPIHISKILVGDTGITVDLEFENASNRSFFLNTAGISGSDAILVDAEFRSRNPVTVSPSLSRSIGPTEEKWNAGEFNSGSLTFARPHPHAMRRLLVSFPTYESLILTFDESSRSYSAKVVEIGNPGQSETGLHPLRVSANLYTGLSRFLEKATEALHDTRIVDYLSHFASGSQAREGQAPFLTGMSRISPANVKLVLAREQQLTLDPNGRVEDVSVFFDYLLPLPGGNHQFRSLVICSFREAPETGDWLIDRWRFAKQPPFWLIGMTDLQSSEHFSIFSRPGVVTTSRISDVQTQLERAYAILQANEHLDLEQNYVAFLIDRPEDFQFLTAKNALRYHGAASTSYTVEGNRYVTLNQAMFLNEQSFRHDSSEKEKARRLQTITHELAHLALAPDTRHFTPAWLSEGIAVNLANQLTPGSRRALIETGGLPVLSLSALSRGGLSGEHMSGQAVLNFEYIYSGEAVAYLIRTYGEKSFFDYYRSFARITPAELEALAMEQTISAEGTPASIPKLMHQITLELTRRQFGISLYDLDTVLRSNISLQSR